MTTTTDPRAAFLDATAAALDAVLDLPSETLDFPTPCTDFDVRTLRGHLLSVFRRIAHVGRGGAPFDVPHVTALPDAGVDPALLAAADDARSVWADPVLLGREMTHPAGLLPGAAVLAAYVAELCTHAWDLAAATGRTVPFDPATVGVGSAASRAMLPPGRRPAEYPFGDEVPAPEEATAMERLAAWQGRDPGWRR